ncbi:unnamed protein product, partial [Didymodactylos carnosus]
AGPDYNTRNSTIPNFAAFAQDDAVIRWDYHPYTFNKSINQTILYPRASAVGGCTRHTELVTFAANPSDWDNIANVTGDTSWNHVNMQQYWELVEKCQYCKTTPLKGGWLNVAQPMRNVPRLMTNP